MTQKNNEAEQQNKKAKSGTLYVVATPIGNLEDISHRAITILSSVDLIAAEDTRQSRKLLNHFGINTHMIAVHEHNERQILLRLIDDLQNGKSIALISDAGTPLISDPGFNLLQAVQKAGLTVSPIPGPCAAIAALSVAALPTNAFYFAGFLPAKSGKRIDALQNLNKLSATLIFYEAPHRVQETIDALLAVLGNRHAALAKELTKTYEAIVNGTLSQLKDWLTENPDKILGEFVLLVEGNEGVQQSSEEEVLGLTLLRELLVDVPVKRAVQIVTTCLGLKKNWVYDQAVLIKEDLQS